MASVETIQTAFDRFEREQKIRDDGLRRAFGLLCDEIKRLQTMTGDLLKEAMERADSQTGTMAELTAALDAHPERLFAAMRAIRDGDDGVPEEDVDWEAPAPVKSP
jgi:hypothetical protein